MYDTGGKMTTSVKRPLTLIATSVMVLLGIGGSVYAEDDSDSRDDRRVKIGFDIAAQQKISLDSDDPAVGLGSYLVNAMGCNDCHTWPNYAPGGDPYSRQPKQVPLANYLGGGRLFTLPTEDVCSRNITPAPHTNWPAGLSRPDFFYVLRTGCDPQDPNFRDPQKCELLQVMPWPNYQEMKKKDLAAIYSYLSALPYADPSPLGKSSGGCPPASQGVAGE
jgi:hypothetical protein